MVYFNPSMIDNENIDIPIVTLSVLAAISAAIISVIEIVMNKRSTTTYEIMYARDKIDESNPFSFS
jgi:hypothetical protein